MEEKAFWEKRNFIQSVWFELPEEKRGYPLILKRWRSAENRTGRAGHDFDRRKRQRKIDDIGGNRSGSRL